MTEDFTVNCRDACGASAEDDRAAQHAGWHYLSLTRSWRCGTCAHALASVVGKPGRVPTPADALDTLPPGSRGALPKDTSGTIAAPVVTP